MSVHNLNFNGKQREKKIENYFINLNGKSVVVDTKYRSWEILTPMIKFQIILVDEFQNK